MSQCSPTGRMQLTIHRCNPRFECPITVAGFVTSACRYESGEPTPCRRGRHDRRPFGELAHLSFRSVVIPIVQANAELVLGAAL
jgi:hypothetical protein